MKLNCDFFQKAISDAHDDDGAELRSEVLEHVCGCADCAAFQAFCREIEDGVLTDLMPGPGASAELRSQIVRLPSIPEQWRRREVRRGQGFEWRWVQGLAAALAICVTGWWLLEFDTTPRVESKKTAAEKMRKAMLARSTKGIAVPPAPTAMEKPLREEMSALRADVSRGTRTLREPLAALLVP